MSETIAVKKETIQDLIRIKNEFDTIVESLELMSNKEFMESYDKAKNQIKKRDFANFDEI